MSIVSGLFGVPGSWTWTIAVCVVLLVMYGWHPIKRWQYRHIPGPPPTWLVGNLLSIIRMGFPEANQKWAAKYGPVFKVWQGGSVLIVVEDPVAVRAVNMRNHDRPPILSSWAGEQKDFDHAGVLLADGGKYWQALRQAWQAMFLASSLRGYMDLMNASAERLVNVLAKKAETGEPVEIWRLFGCLTMEVVGSTAFGLELRTLEGDVKTINTNDADITFDDADDDAIRLQKAAAVLFGFSGARVSPYIAVNLLFPDVGPLVRQLATRFPDAALGKALTARLAVQDVCYRLIRDAKQRTKLEALNNGAADDSSTAAAPTNSDAQAAVDGQAELAADGKQPQRKRMGALPPGGFMSHLLSGDNKLIGRKLTDFEVAAQAFTFLLAGYETTASALAFTVYHVANNLDKEARLLEEIDAFGRDKIPTYDDLDNFPYLEAVFSEALRLTPPAAFGTIRVAREDFELCGLTIRKGWFLNTAQFSFQNNSKYWDDVDKFLPERYLTDKGTNMPAWAPFGDGGRSCVGIRFAKAEAKIALIRLYQKLTLRLVDGQVPLETKTTITMAPKNGIRVTVHPRPE